MVVLGGGAVSYKRGTPVTRMEAKKRWSGSSSMCIWMELIVHYHRNVQRFRGGLVFKVHRGGLVFKAHRPFAAWQAGGEEGGSGGMDRAPRKVDVRLPEKGNSNSHGARPVHLIITMITWIRTSRLSIKNCLSHARLEAKKEAAVVWMELNPNSIISSFLCKVTPAILHGVVSPEVSKP